MNNQDPNQASLFPQIIDNGFFTLKFETERHSVDATLVANALLHLEETCRAFAKEIPEIESVAIELTAVESGSLELPISLKLLKNVATSPIVPKIRGWISQLIKLYRFLKSGEPKKIEKKDNQQVVVTNSLGANATFNNSVITVYNLTALPPVGDLSSRQQSDIEAISILDEKKQVEERIEKKEYGSFRKRIKTLPDGDEQTEEIDRTLVLATIPILDPGKHSWGFEQDGFRFSAKIEDPEFVSLIQNRQVSFQRGDSIKVRLSLLKRYNPQEGRFVIVKRRVLRVLSSPKLDGNLKDSIF